ncbi:alternative oxidase-5 [Purpureocillium lavendulum]|uniref:Alternative oxidase-5 n=1 Tax=Purpureocillium lavendulum TaxID=1247861 RepID=A0AB34FTG9_9HYPO|nr:alternative oxidase-5 [Purpureocillium lavendulum]
MKFFIAVLALAATAIAAPTECKSCQEHHKKPVEHKPEHKPEHHEPSNNNVGNVCQSHQTVVCQGQGNGGLLSLGNLLPGALGENCSGGDVYCCSHDDVKQVRTATSPLPLIKTRSQLTIRTQTGLINLDLNVQCSLNRVL